MIGVLSETVKTVKQAKKQDVLAFFICFFVAIAFIGLSFFLIDMASESKRLGDLTEEDPIVHLAETLRNAAWVLWVGLTIASLIVGFGILNRGQEQKKEGFDQKSFTANLQMLASDSIMLRVAAIKWLQKLIEEYPKIGQMYLKPFIKYIWNYHMGEDQKNKRFLDNKPLPDDIQLVANGISIIANSFPQGHPLALGKLEVPRDLWKKINFFHKITTRDNDRRLAIKAIQKGVKKAKSYHYKTKFSDCMLCGLFYFLNDKIAYFARSPVNKAIIGAEERMEKSDNTVWISEYTWEKEKYNFYKDIEEKVMDLCIFYFQEFGTINRPKFPDRIWGIFMRVSKRLERQDKENLEITLPSYFWKNQHKDPVTFPSAILTENGTDMKKANLVESNLRGANLEGVILEEANLKGADLRRANFKKAKMKKAKLPGAIVLYADLREAILIEAELEKAVFNMANLKGANMARAKLKGTDLWRVNLKGANMKGAGLEGANLTEANLEKAALNKANLKEAKIARANLSGADMNLVTGVTKEQILSAVWGIGRKGESKSPILPDKLRKDKDIKEWLEKPHYDLSKLSEEKWKETLEKGLVLELGGRVWRIRFESEQ